MGGIIAFLNSSFSYMVVQEITKYSLLVVSQLFFSTYIHAPKLNSVLLPIIENLGKENGYNIVVVVPVGKQGELLKQYYGFKTLNDARITDSLYEEYCPNSIAITSSAYKPMYKKI